MAYDICPDCGRSVPVQSRMMDRCGVVGPVNYCDCPCGNVWEVKQKLQVVPFARGRDYMTAQDGDLIIVTRPDGYSYSTGVREVLDCCHYIDHHGNTQHISQTVRNDYRRDPERTKVEIIKGGMRQVSPSLKVWPRVKNDPLLREIDSPTMGKRIASRSVAKKKAIGSSKNKKKTASKTKKKVRR